MHPNRNLRHDFFLEFRHWISSRAVINSRNIRSKPLRSILILIVVSTLLLYISSSVVALSNHFVQTTWSGGADTNATADDTNLTNWTKYYSKTNGVDDSTSGEIKLNLEISQP